MLRSYSLVNSNRSRIKGLSEIQIIKKKFFLNIIFINSANLSSNQGEETPVMTPREELKI